MAFSSATVSVGGVTRQSDYQRVMDNTIALRDEDIITSKQACKAWVNFDGTTNTAGKCTIADSYNVTDVDDLGAGNYRINFTNNFADTNYATVGSAISTTTPLIIGFESATKAVSSIEVHVNNNAGGASDGNEISVQIFGS